MRTRAAGSMPPHGAGQPQRQMIAILRTLSEESPWISDQLAERRNRQTVSGRSLHVLCSMIQIVKYATVSRISLPDVLGLISATVSRECPPEDRPGRIGGIYSDSDRRSRGRTSRSDHRPASAEAMQTATILINPHLQMGDVRHTETSLLSSSDDDSGKGGEGGGASASSGHPTEVGC